MSEEKIAEIMEAMREATRKATQSKEAALAWLERIGVLQHTEPLPEPQPKRTPAPRKKRKA